MFTMSAEELRRREKAFDRLGLSAVLAFVVGSADIFAGFAPLLLGGAACLATLYVASRVALAAGNRRYARTTWRIDDGTLTRADLSSRRDYDLHALRGAQAKRTTAGEIREIKLSFDGGPVVYVNGLDDAESFWDALDPSSFGVAPTFVQEPIDYDHPLFYVALGCAIGLSISLIVRVAISAPRLSGHWVYVALAAYSLAVGVYWLRSKPISGRYSTHAIAWDYAIAAAALLCFVGSTIAAVIL